MGRKEIIKFAKQFLGYTEGENNDTIFGDWYGLPHQPWCAMYVSYCSVNSGISEDIVPRFASCTTGFRTFENMGVATREHIEPQEGDIIFFIWSKGEATPDHVGLVEKVENGRIYTIEGNRSDKVQEFDYDLDSWQIYGYATPNYEEQPEPQPQPVVIEQVEVRVNSLLRIRAGAGTQYAKVGELYNGDIVNIYEKEGNWGRCDTGWICLDYTIEYSPEPQPSGYVLGLYQVNTPSGLNVRTSPVDGNIIKAYPNKTRFDTYEIQDNWGRTPSGWVCLDYCKLIREY